MNNEDSTGVGFGFTSFADRPPTMPPIGKTRLPRRCPNSIVIPDHEHVKLISTARDRSHRGAGRRPTSIQFPPAMPPVCKRRLPCRRQDCPVHVCDEDVELIGAAGHCMYRCALRHTDIAYRPPAMPPVGEAGRRPSPSTGRPSKSTRPARKKSPTRCKNRWVPRGVRRGRNQGARAVHCGKASTARTARPTSLAP
jgi:hypothetical protein